MEKNSQSFLATKEPKFAEKVKGDYDVLAPTIKSGLATIQGGDKLASIQESKLQTLDQLIAETMRDIKRKRKK